MTQIGQFTRVKSGYAGHLRTLSLDIELVLVPADVSEVESAPDYRIHVDSDDGLEVGAGWKRTSERAGDYVSLLLDDPAFPQPIHANLFRASDAPDAWALQWTRLSRSGGKA
jgi:uncharacterized protein (DUF736 family)